MYRWIKIDHHFPIKYDSLQIVTQSVTAGIHRAWIIHVQAGNAVKAQPCRTVFMKITPQPQSYLLVERSPLWMWWEDFCHSAKLCWPRRDSASESCFCQRAAPQQLMGTPHSGELSDVQILKFIYMRGIVGLQQAENISFSQLNYSLEIICSAPVPSNKRVHFSFLPHSEESSVNISGG